MLLFFDGFDYLATADVPKRWTSGTGTIGATGRNGTSGIAPSQLLAGVVSSGSTAIVGFAIKPDLASGSMLTIAVDDASSGAQVILRTKADGAIEVVRGGSFTVLATSAPGLLVAGTHYYIELNVLIDNAVGTVEVHVDEVAVIAASGLDTQQASVATWNIVMFSAGTGLDDVYVCDAAGAVNNDFLGNCHVDALLAVADSVAAGTHAQLTPSTGTDHGALVDEAAPNTADYNGAGAVGLRDSYRVTAATVGVTVHGVQGMVLVAKTDTKQVTFAPILIADGVQYAGETCYPGVDYEYFAQIEARHPGDGGQWAPATLASIEVGLARTA